MEHSPKINTGDPGLPPRPAIPNGHTRGREQSPGRLNSLESAKSLISPSMRFPLPRALSPDLPTRDALYLFCNFSSYMRSPHEGAEGIRNHEDFRDTIRLLDHARGLATIENSNVQVLHLKYRFSGQASQFRSPYGDEHPSQSAPGGNGGHAASQEPVPQPFSVMHDAVIKIDYKENGVFSPLPAQAVFTHLTSRTQPPPRIIVVSYISSRATQNHLASLSTWAIASTPPTYVFSPLETRIRETQPLPVALKYAIPMSMYAEPPGLSSPARLPPTVPAASPSRTTIGRRLSTSDMQGVDTAPGIVQSASQPEKQYPPAPIASLSIEAGEATAAKMAGAPANIGGRIPLWALASGVGVLNGSTSNSVGVKLEDFSAIKLVDAARASLEDAASGHAHSPCTVSPNIESTAPPVEAPHRSGTPSRAFITNDSTRVVGKLTMPTHLTPPDARIVAVGPVAQTGSCPTSISKVVDWRKGRKETMEEVLQAAGVIGGVREIDSKMDVLTVSDEEHNGFRPKGGALYETGKPPSLTSVTSLDLL